MILICFCSNPQKRVPAAFSGKHQSTDIVIFYSHNSYFEVMNHGKSNYALLVLNSLRFISQTKPYIDKGQILTSS